MPCHFIHSCQSCIYSFMSFHWHLNSHLPIRWCTSQPQHFIASASNRHVNVYRPFISNRISMFRPGLLVSYAIHILSLFTWDAQWNIICGLLLWMSQFGMISNSPKNAHPIMDGLLLWIQHYGEHTHTHMCIYIYACICIYIYTYYLIAYIAGLWRKVTVSRSPLQSLAMPGGFHHPLTSRIVVAMIPSKL